LVSGRGWYVIEFQLLGKLISSSKNKIYFKEEMVKKLIGIVLPLFLTLALFVPAFADVTPSSVTGNLAPGTSMTVDKTVTTPVIPPKPDIVFLCDTTGSMFAVIDNMKANVVSIMDTVLSGASDAQFAVAEYKDQTIGGDPFDYQLDQSMTANQLLVQAAVNTWDSDTYGGDIPEQQLYALDQIATSLAVGFRDGSTHIIVWMGDSSGHSPSGPTNVTLADVISDLTTTGANAPILVIAIPVDSGSGDGLDSTGQATAITSATSGILLPDALPDQVSDAILAGLSNLPITVSWSVNSDAGLDISLLPASQTVTSGDNAYFTETIMVAGDAPQCETLYATVTFSDENDNVLGTQDIAININDVTPPSVASTETVNPAGKNIPPAGYTTLPGPKGGMNEDGFYLLTAEDNCDENPMIYVTDTSGTVFGPFPSGTVVKFTEGSGATPEMKPMGGPNSAVQWHIILTSDATVFAVDDAGNVSDLDIQYVPPLPK
jgi:hypothetical protein